MSVSIFKQNLTHFWCFNIKKHTSECRDDQSLQRQKHEEQTRVDDVAALHAAAAALGGYRRLYGVRASQCAAGLPGGGAVVVEQPFVGAEAVGADGSIGRDELL